MEKQREIAEREIKEIMGFVPDFYKALPEPAINAAWQLQKTLELGETVLDTKTKELIGLAVASHMKCQYCVYFHSTAAEAFGATKEEIREASLMGGMTAMMSNAITGAQVDFEQFKKDVDKAIDFMMRQSAQTQTGKGAPLQ
jgi:AhpD family alkylhydroperoxidase